MDRRQNQKSVVFNRNVASVPLTGYASAGPITKKDEEEGPDREEALLRKLDELIVVLRQRSDYRVDS